MFCVSFSGVPGVGKTTLLKRLQATNMLDQLLGDVCHVKFVFEPSDLWREKGWLQKYYANPHEKAFWFQLVAFDTHVEQVRKVATESPPNGLPTVLFMERSMYDQLLFWNMQIQMGYKSATDEDNQEAYLRMWQKWKLLVPPVELIFFCDTSSVQKTMRRIFNREGGEEGVDHVVTRAGGIGLDYQTQLHDMHAKWFTAPFALHDRVACEHLSMDGAFNTDDEALGNLAISIATSVESIAMKNKKKSEV